MEPRLRIACCACASLFIVVEASGQTGEMPLAGSLAADAAAAAALMYAEPIVPDDGRWIRKATGAREAARPAALVPLYASFAALQALDAQTTIAGLRRGHTEANPVLAPVAGRPALLIGAKSAIAVGTIVVSEKLWRRHRTAAVALMVAVNAAHAAVVVHNYRRLRR
ncbi:MAG TPA: DUF5658 family protein [Vicinamibacterales bacterium]|nr:DUF5658 family protein [Vicinamibacterales bacterium]